jgi:hypothetical protein
LDRVTSLLSLSLSRVDEEDLMRRDKYVSEFGVVVPLNALGAPLKNTINKS